MSADGSTLSTEQAALRIFDAALDRPDAERDAYVRAACADNPALLARVQRLLDAEAASEDSTRSVRALAGLSEARPAESVGAYRLVELLGEGGMGSVYRAERADGAFERTVAIKFIQARLHSSSLMKRFESERQIMASLTHPNITALLDGGSSEGQPYLVMEFVDGEPFRFDPGVSVRRQLKRFAKVCDAVGHAHGALILHRDIKPDNVLITGDGEPKLLDFGIAKLTDAFADSEDLTGMGATPMTFNYAAPELLAGGQASVASDVYALGVLLREVLTGTRAYDVSGLSLIEARQQVESLDRPAAQTGSRDLDTIIATAMHPDRERRYRTAEALSDDVRRYLDNRPIQARTDDRWYVFRRFLRRNRAGSALAATAATVIVGLLIATLSALQVSEKQRLLAEENATTADAAVGFLVQTLSQANPLVSMNPVTTIDEALEAAERALDEAGGADPSRRTYLQAALAEIYAGRGQADRAAALIDQARPATVALSPALRLPTQGSLAEALFRLGRYAEAHEIASTASADADADPAGVLMTMGTQVEASVNLGDLERAATEIAAMIEWYDTFDLDNPGVLARAFNARSNMRATQGDFDAAEVAMLKTLELLEEAGEAETANGLQANANYASILAAAQRFEHAERQYLQTLSTMAERLGRAHPWHIWATASFGLMYNHQGKPIEGVAVMEPLLPAVESEFEPLDETRVYFEAKLGFTLCKAGRLDDGLRLLDRALSARLVIYPPGHWTVPDAEMAIGYCYMEQGNDGIAGDVLLSAHRNFVAAHGADHPSTKSVETMLDSIGLTP